MSPPLRSRLSHQPGRSRGMEQGRGCRGAAGPGSEKQRGAGERRIWSSTIPPPPCCPSATARCSQPTRPVTGRASAVTGAASPWKSARSGAGRGAAGHDQARRGPGGGPGARSPRSPLPSTAHCVTGPGRQHGSRHRCRGAGGGGCQSASGERAGLGRDTGGKGAGMGLSSHGNPSFAPPTSPSSESTRNPGIT